MAVKYVASLVAGKGSLWLGELGTLFGTSVHEVSADAAHYLRLAYPESVKVTEIPIEDEKKAK